MKEEGEGEGEREGSRETSCDNVSTKNEKEKTGGRG
jgi:hypothetical protein